MTSPSRLADRIKEKDRRLLNERFNTLLDFIKKEFDGETEAIIIVGPARTAAGHNAFDYFIFGDMDYFEMQWAANAAAVQLVQKVERERLLAEPGPAEAYAQKGNQDDSGSNSPATPNTGF